MENGGKGQSPKPPLIPNLTELALGVQEEDREKAKAREEEKKPRNGPIRPLLILALIVALGLVIVVDPYRPEPVQPVPTRTSLREVIYVTALALDAEFEETGAYPAELESIGMDEEGLTYTRGPEGYTLVAEAEGIQVGFRSGDDMEPFRAAFEALLPPFEGGR